MSYKIQALEAYKVSIVLKGMTEKLDYLDKLKNNMGEEMAEMMSEEITKVMDEQRDMEQTYARLITERGQLKGISNKARLHDTMGQITTVAKDLKESTRKLCRQLQDNPDVEGNQREIKRHKKELIEWNERLKDELLDLKFENFATNIAKELANQSEFERLRAEEKKLNQDIKKVTDDERRARDETAKQQHEDNLEISEKKKLVNETEVEAKLHIQYMERFIEGNQSCKDRLYKKEESKMEKQIDALRNQLDTEALVTSTIKGHLQKKQAELQAQTKERDQKKDREGAELEKEKERVQGMRTAAQDEYEDIKKLVAEDDEYRANLAKMESEKKQAEEEKIKEKMSMDDAARFIQRKWNWFQTVGRFLAKKKKGRKGKKGKKKG